MPEKSAIQVADKTVAMKGPGNTIALQIVFTDPPSTSRPIQLSRSLNDSQQVNVITVRSNEERVLDELYELLKPYAEGNFTISNILKPDNIHTHHRNILWFLDFKNFLELLCNFFKPKWLC